MPLFCARSLSRYAVRAVLWDQGESNGGDSADYFSCLFQVGSYALV